MGLRHDLDREVGTEGALVGHVVRRKKECEKKKYCVFFRETRKIFRVRPLIFIAFLSMSKNRDRPKFLK